MLYGGENLNWSKRIFDALKDNYNHIFHNNEYPQLRIQAIIFIVFYFMLFFSSFIPGLSFVTLVVIGTFIGFLGIFMVLFFGFIGLINVYITSVVNISSLFLLEEMADFITGISFHTMILISATIIAFLSENSRKRKKSLKEMSIKDELTGLYNIRFFHHRLIEELSRADRNNNFVSLLMMDLDGFKYFNDNYGHVVGDYVLKESANLISSAVRPSDIVCRYGGDEFIVILPEADENVALKVANRIQDRFKNGIVLDGNPYRVKFSIGISVYPAISSDKKKLVKSADDAVYVAKKNESDRIQIGTSQ